MRECDNSKIHISSNFLFINFLSNNVSLVGFGLINCRLVFSAGRFLQSAVASCTFNPPTWRTSDQKIPTSATRCPLRLKRRERTPPTEDGTMIEKLPRILPKVVTSTSLLGSFKCRKCTIWDRRLYFPSEGRRAEDFFRPKNPTASAGFEPEKLGTRSQHAYLQTTEAAPTMFLKNVIQNKRRRVRTHLYVKHSQIP